MYSIKKILVPVDFSDNSMIALDYACNIAKLAEAQLILVHVIESLPSNNTPFIFTNPAIDSYQAKIVEMCTSQLTEIAANYTAKYGVTVNHASVIGRTHRDIKDFSEKIKADLIVMGTHGTSGLREFVAGSNTFRVVTDATCPVLSIQLNTASVNCNTILVPFRDKPHSREKVDYAIAFAKICGAKILVLGIDTEQDEEHLKRIQLEGNQIFNIVEASGVKCDLKVIAADYRPDLVINYAKENNADLIVAMSDLDKDSIMEYFTGSFAQQLVNHSTIPVLSIQPMFNTDTVDLRFY